MSLCVPVCNEKKLLGRPNPPIPILKVSQSTDDKIELYAFLLSCIHWCVLLEWGGGGVFKKLLKKQKKIFYKLSLFWF